MCYKFLIWHLLFLIIVVNLFIVWNFILYVMGYEMIKDYYKD